ncbi:hypothetical protein C8R45DRAFT_174138 [Mycena sanguinolenta]|nr:hypothetical protein C8R45DRAFT_174138 [Mycena sanguinolenta]
MWTWRTSSLVIVAIPALMLLLVIIGTIIRIYLGGELAELVFVVIMVLTTPIYIAARIILIVLPLVELRSLPASAFVDVNWSTYIPHI